MTSKGVSLVIDITKHKLLEEELKRHRDALKEIVVERTRALVESEERYRSVMAAVPDPIVVYDHYGKVSYINPGFTRIFGWTFQKILGKKAGRRAAQIVDDMLSFSRNSSRGRHWVI